MSAVKDINGHRTHTNIITDVHITAKNPRPPRHQHSGENDGNSSPTVIIQCLCVVRVYTNLHSMIVREGLKCQARRLL